MKKVYLLFFLSFFSISFSQSKIKRNLFCLFFENKGQILDQNGKQNLDVKYILNSAGLNVQLKKTGFSYDVYEVKKSAVIQKKNKVENNNSKFFDNKQNSRTTYNFHRIDIDFLNPSKNLEIIAEGKSKDFNNYVDTKNIKNSYKVFAYQKIIYKNLYPKIDLVFFKPNDSIKPVEYNFIINPGGKISDIQLKFSGAKTEIKNGKISMNLRFGEMQESVPKSWIEEKNSNINIEVNFKDLGNGIFGFQSGTNICARKIVIDPIPTRIWGTYYGGGDSEVIGGIKTDLKNNVYIFGKTGSPNNIATIGAYEPILPGLQSGFIAKLDASGNRIWGTYLDAFPIRDLDFDSEFNCYITGSSAFLLKLDPLGNPILFNSIGTNGSNFDAYSIAVSENNFYLGGSSTTFSNDGQSQTGGFISKCDLSGNIIWTSLIGGYTSSAKTTLNKIFIHNDEISGIGITQSSTTLITKNPFPVIGLDPSTEPFYGVYARYSADGTLLQCSYLNFSDYASTTNGGMPLDAKIINNTLIISGLQYVFAELKSKWVVRKFDLTTNKLLSNTLFDFPPSYLYHGSDLTPVFRKDLYGVCSFIDDNGNVFFGATAPANTTYATSGAYMEEKDTFNKSFILKVKNDDNLDWLTYYRGNAETSEAFISTDKDNNIFVAGNSYNNSYGIATYGTYQQNQGSVTTPDIFLVKFRECVPNIPNPPKMEICFGSTLQLNANSGTSYHWTGPNNFNSNLQNPTVANMTSVKSGNYYCTISGITECEQNIRITVLVKPEVPIVTGNSEQEFCELEHSTVASLYVIGQNIKWYDYLGNFLLPSTLLVNGQTYFATQTIDGCEGLNKFAVLVKITPNSVPAQDYNIEECNDTNDATKLVNLTDFNANIIYNNTIFTFEYFDQNNTAISDPTKANLNVGTNFFNVKVSNAFGCNKTIKLTLILDPKPQINLPSNIEFCPGQNLILDAGSGFNSYYWWANGETTQTINVTQPGNYTVSVTNKFGCKNTSSVQVIYSSSVSITKVDVSGDTATVIMSNPGNFLYSLDNATFQNSNIFANLKDGIYTVYVKSKSGCDIGSSKFTIFTTPKVSNQNVITPDGDGINDTWRISGIENYPGTIVEIYDRFGKRVFQKTVDGDFSWDGKYNSQVLPTDSYWYIIKFTNGKVQNGWIFLKNRN
jgi:gliding motility-associated-like protein